MTKVAASIVMLLFTGCSGTLDPAEDVVPAALVPFQGEWDFDEARFLDDRHASAKSGEEAARFRKLYDEGKARGAGVCPRIRMSGATIVGEGSILEDRYDILEHHAEGKALVCKAEYHEDRHDPGDSSVVDLVLELVASPRGDMLVLKRGQGAPPIFYKKVR